MSDEFTSHRETVKYLSNFKPDKGFLVLDSAYFKQIKAVLDYRCELPMCNWSCTTIFNNYGNNGSNNSGNEDNPPDNNDNVIPDSCVNTYSFNISDVIFTSYYSVLRIDNNSIELGQNASPSNIGFTMSNLFAWLELQGINVALQGDILYLADKTNNKRLGYISVEDETFNSETGIPNTNITEFCLRPNSSTPADFPNSSDNPNDWDTNHGLNGDNSSSGGSTNDNTPPDSTTTNHQGMVEGGLVFSTASSGVLKNRANWKEYLNLSDRPIEYIDTNIFNVYRKCLEVAKTQVDLAKHLSAKPYLERENQSIPAPHILHREDTVNYYFDGSYLYIVHVTDPRTKVSKSYYNFSTQLKTPTNDEPIYFGDRHYPPFSPIRHIVHDSITDSNGEPPEVFIQQIVDKLYKETPYGGILVYRDNIPEYTGGIIRQGYYSEPFTSVRTVDDFLNYPTIISVEVLALLRATGSINYLNSNNEVTSIWYEPDIGIGVDGNLSPEASALFASDTKHISATIISDRFIKNVDTYYDIYPF